MKKLIASLFFITFLYNNIYTQNVNGISTNPQNPIDNFFIPWAQTHIDPSINYNPFLNHFNWEDINGNYIPLFYNKGFNIGGISTGTTIYPMLNPFATGMSASSSKYIDEFLKPNPIDRDFRWKDGWELLWMNLGYTPDNAPIDSIIANSPFAGPQTALPAEAPYFVLYNRYKGTIRVFANAFFNGTNNAQYQKIYTNLAFSTSAVNGMLRHTSSSDLALDNQTKIKDISGPSFQPAGHPQWLMSDFQIGFDPCICNRNEAKLLLTMSTINTMNIEMISRSISVDQAFTDNNYLSEDFLNLSDARNTNNNYKAGSKIYSKMDGMLDAYNKALIKYQSDLANYNSLDAILKRGVVDVLKTGVAAGGNMFGSGVAGSLLANAPLRDFVLKNKTRTGLYSGGLIDLDSNNANDFANSVVSGSKSILAQGFDFFSAQLDVPNEPVKPTPPTATYTETSYQGNITQTNFYSSGNLLVPGALPNGYNGGNPGIDRLNYPAYNEVLGLFALLETPKIQVKAINTNPGIPTYVSHGSNTLQWRYFAQTNTKDFQTNYQVKLVEPLKYRFNHVVDFNFDKTKLYYSFRIKLKNKFPKVASVPTPASNVAYLGAYFDRTKPYTINNAGIVEKDFYNVEEYGANDEYTVVITSPFAEVKNSLNEPLSMTHVITMGNFNLELLVKSLQNVDLNNPNDRNFDIILKDFSNIESIELKLMADMYFISKGSKDQELNTLQTFTYKLYDHSDGDNQMPDGANTPSGNVAFLNQNQSLMKHQQGNVVFDNIQLNLSTVTQYPFHLVSGNEIHIWVENAILKQNVSVAAGYTAYIHFVGNAISNAESAWIPELVLDNMKSEDLYNNPFVYEATNEEVNQFCNQNTNKYKANTSLSKTLINNENVTDKDKEENKFAFRLYPNPSNDKTTVLYQLTDDVVTQVSIYNIAGELVQSMAINSNEITNNQVALNTQGLSAGIYFVTLSTGNNQSVTQKLVIAK
ncbi:MAG: T9SS type A sorting domain-containing protein [Bacteroidota bacterium]